MLSCVLQGQKASLLDGRLHAGRQCIGQHVPGSVCTHQAYSCAHTLGCFSGCPGCKLVFTASLLTLSDDTDYYGSELDWLFEDDGDLLGLLLTLPTTRAADASSSPKASPSDGPAPALPVYAVFASSSRGPVVPSTVDASPTEEAAKAKPLELIVAPLGVGAKPPHPTQDPIDFDPRCDKPL